VTFNPKVAGSIPARPIRIPSASPNPHGRPSGLCDSSTWCDSVLPRCCPRTTLCTRARRSHSRNHREWRRCDCQSKRALSALSRTAFPSRPVRPRGRRAAVGVGDAERASTGLRRLDRGLRHEHSLARVEGAGLEHALRHLPAGHGATVTRQVEALLLRTRRRRLPGAAAVPRGLPLIAALCVGVRPQCDLRSSAVVWIG
jgi:hypothetical protein